MPNLKSLLTSVFVGCSLFALQAQIPSPQWRPNLHFSPQRNWTNDPNGLIYVNGYYHLFFQHNPFGIDWGNMSWGHARSKDLLHWEELPLAIPNGKEFIFSGGVVEDKAHVSGLGDPKKPLLIAIYTADYPNTREEQHLAFSNDEGLTWTKYEKNPVLNINYKDFRDPNVFWHDGSQQFIMVVAKPKEYKISIYASSNLLDWQWQSDVGPTGDTSMIWECPSLMQLPVEGQSEPGPWVLMMSSQGPYKDYVGMQYLVGSFDGKHFVPQQAAQYVDYGRDFYAAIPFQQSPGAAPLWLGWALSWKYAKEQPTYPWKGQMSFPRKLKLIQKGHHLVLSQSFFPLPSQAPDLHFEDKTIKEDWTLSGIQLLQSKTYLIHLVVASSKAKRWLLEWRGNSNKEELTQLSYQVPEKVWTFDRRQSGKIISNDFATLDLAPTQGLGQDLWVLVDKSLVEVLAERGSIAISNLRFPSDGKERLTLKSIGGKTNIKKIEIWEWKP